MAKSTNEIQVTEEMLANFEVGQKIDRYCFFTNITYQGMEGDNVVIHDKDGNVKKDPKWLFLKHARIAK